MPKTIKYGVYDGFATRFTDDGEIWVLAKKSGRWFEPSRPVQVLCYECGVLSEAEYHRIFGDDLPPLPIAAFGGDSTIGWKSPLV